MTAFFVRKFKSQNKCPHCKSEKLTGYSLCTKHLEEAKLRFRLWSVERRVNGKCCFCDCKSFRGWLRCRRHAKINRERVRKWYAAHPGYGNRQWKHRLALRQQGICACWTKGKLQPGQRRCNTCIARRPAYRVSPEAVAKAVERAKAA